MRWILLLVGMVTHTIVFSQSTFKIYVDKDDNRSDMEIIDLNTMAIEADGVSVDSTNISFYSVTMSTQVLRVTLVEPLREAQKSKDQIQNGGTQIESNSESVTSGSADISSTSSTTLSTPDNDAYSRKTVSGSIVRRTGSFKSVKHGRKSRKPRKGKRLKKYRGKCPRFF